MESATLSSEGARVRRSASQDEERVWMTRVVASCSNTHVLLETLNSDGFSGRTSPEYCRRTAGAPLEPYSDCWKTAGILSHGECLTLNSSEYHRDAAACFLSDILEPSAPRRFYLSPRACRGLLRRARTKERSLPPELEEALLAQASSQE